jgi:transcriptional regulator NrdR family protein
MSDMERRRKLELMGIGELRFWNNEVMSNLEGVLEKIKLHLTSSLAKEEGSYEQTTEKTLKKIIKRDGREVAFEMKNVVRAISKAVAETGEFDEAEAKRLAGIVVTILTKANGHHIPTVEEVQDIVEQVLMAGGHYKTAKAYILYRQKRSQVRQAESMIGVEDDLGLSLNQLKVIERRYLLHDEDGKVIETPKAWLTG